MNPRLRELVELRQKGKKFEHVVNNPTQGDLVSLLGQSLVGSALTAIFVCVSQVSHTQNHLWTNFKTHQIFQNKKFKNCQKNILLFKGSSQCPAEQTRPGVWGDLL